MTRAGETDLVGEFLLPEDRFGKLVAKQLDRMAGELRPEICLRLEVARNTALGRRRQF